MTPLMNDDMILGAAEVSDLDTPQAILDLCHYVQANALEHAAAYCDETAAMIRAMKPG